MVSAAPSAQPRQYWQALAARLGANGSPAARDIPNNLAHARVPSWGAPMYAFAPNTIWANRYALHMWTGQKIGGIHTVRVSARHNGARLRRIAQGIPNTWLPSQECARTPPLPQWRGNIPSSACRLGGAYRNCTCTGCIHPVVATYQSGTCPTPISRSAYIAMVAVRNGVGYILCGEHHAKPVVLVVRAPQPGTTMDGRATTRHHMTCQCPR